MHNYKITFFDHILLIECPIVYGILPILILHGLDYINWYISIIVLILWWGFIYFYYLKPALYVLFQEYNSLTINVEEKYVLLKKWTKVKKINFKEIDSFKVNIHTKATSGRTSTHFAEILIVLSNCEKYSIYVSPSEELLSMEYYIIKSKYKVNRQNFN